MYVASPEDTIANKLYYGSEQDIQDAGSISVRWEDLDHQYLDERCETLGVKQELKEMVEEVEELID